MSKLEYPKTLREFRQKFSTDQSCLEYLAKSRWPDGFQCPNCKSHKAWLNKNRYVYECQQCGRQTSPMAGTALHRSKIPVQEWFWSGCVAQIQRGKSVSFFGVDKKISLVRHVGKAKRANLNATKLNQGIAHRFDTLCGLNTRTKVVPIFFHGYPQLERTWEFIWGKYRLFE